MAVSGSGDAAAAAAATAATATATDEDDHSLTEVVPYIKQEEKEVAMVRPAVPQLELSRRLSDSDDEAAMGAMKGASKDDEEMDDDDDDDKKGSGKIKIEYIANRRARGATFNKRRNGILKKAYELSELTGTVVCAVVFNEQRNKLYEFCSGEPSEVFTRIASYYGYSERRRNGTLRNPQKGYINVAENEPNLAAAARAAAATAAMRHAPARLTAVPQKRNKHNNVKVPSIHADSPVTPLLPTSSPSVSSSAEVRTDGCLEKDERFVEDTYISCGEVRNENVSGATKTEPVVCAPPISAEESVPAPPPLPSDDEA